MVKKTGIKKNESREKPPFNLQADTILKKTASLLKRPAPIGAYKGKVHVGVDLGTAYSVLVVLDENYQPLTGRYQFAQVVRDGVIVDFIGAMSLLRKLKAEVEGDLGFELTHAATSYPPGVPLAEVKATRNVLIGAGLECEDFVDEPTAANALLQIENGAIVDIGGGTTGIAIIEKGKVVYTADEATGGTQFSLVIAGAMNIPFEEAEKVKTNSKNQDMVYSMVFPVMQKVGTIVARHIARFNVKTIYLVGGTSGMKGMDTVIHDITGIPVKVPQHPMFVTPIGIAMHDQINKK